jgi:hypothetical protein
MNEPDDPYITPQTQGDPDMANSGSCIKVLLVWVSPLFAVPLLVAICGGAWPLGAILAIGFLVWMGRISGTDSSGRSGSDTKPQTGRVVLYVVLQLVWIPLFWCAVVWGFCAASGSGTFK